MKLLKGITIFIALLLTGCASSPMMVSNSTSVEVPTNKEATVVFMRSSFVGGAINASLFDVTDGKLEFIGIIANGTKVSYKTTAGKRTFMVVSEAADYLEAEVENGKTYYSIVTPRMGAWKARFSLWPVSASESAKFPQSGKDFTSMLKSTKVAVNTEKSKAWFEGNKQSVLSKHQEYWPVWQSKSQEDIKLRTLFPTDGI